MKVKMTAVMTLRVIVMMIKLVVMNVEICQRVSVMTEVTGEMTLRLVMKVQLASCRVFENAFAETEKGSFSRGKYLLNYH